MDHGFVPRGPVEYGLNLLGRYFIEIASFGKDLARVRHSSEDDIAVPH